MLHMGFSVGKVHLQTQTFWKRREEKSKEHLWLSERLGEPGESHSPPLQGMVWPKRLEQGKTPPSLAAESLISGNYARNCFDGSDEVRSFYPKLRSIFSTLQHSF